MVNSGGSLSLSISGGLHLSLKLSTSSLISFLGTLLLRFFRATTSVDVFFFVLILNGCSLLQFVISSSHFWISSIVLEGSSVFSSSNISLINMFILNAKKVAHSLASALPRLPNSILQSSSIPIASHHLVGSDGSPAGAFAPRFTTILNSPKPYSRPLVMMT